MGRDALGFGFVLKQFREDLPPENQVGQADVGDPDQELPQGVGQPGEPVGDHCGGFQKGGLQGGRARSGHDGPALAHEFVPVFGADNLYTLHRRIFINIFKGDPWSFMHTAFVHVRVNLLSKKRRNWCKHPAKSVKGY